VLHLLVELGEQRHPNPFINFGLDVVLLMLTGNKRGLQELWWARVDPNLDSLRELPRFQEIMTDWDRRLRAMID
jgi:hypothetical protein